MAESDIDIDMLIDRLLEGNFKLVAVPTSKYCYVRVFTTYVCTFWYRYFAIRVNICSKINPVLTEGGAGI